MHPEVVLCTIRFEKMGRSIVRQRTRHGTTGTTAFVDIQKWIVFLTISLTFIWSLNKILRISTQITYTAVENNCETVSSLPSIVEIKSNKGNDIGSVPLAIVTAFSRGHTLEEVAMLQTLVYNNFKGPIYVYFMREVNGHNIDWADEFKSELSKSPLQLTFIDYEVPEYYWSYCFKPRIVGDFLAHYESKINPSTIMWADSSTRFMEDPTLWAQRIIQDDVDFVGRTSSWNLPEQTHDKTFEYYNLTREEFRHDLSIAATHFIVNLAKEKKQNQVDKHVRGTTSSLVERVLWGWIDCGTRACQTCMAPIGSSKNEPTAVGRSHIDGSVQYLSHRQDQAILGLLLRNYTHWKKNTDDLQSLNIQLVDDSGSAKSQYWWLGTTRNKNGPFGGANTVADWKPRNKKERN